MRIRRLHLVLLSLTALLFGACRSEPPPDLVLHHGKIVTVNPAFQVAEAMAVSGDRILAVGTNDDILALAGTATEQVDLGGKTVLPGLIDSHVHAPGASMYEFDHPVPEMETIGDVLQYIRSRVEALDDGAWIRVSQVFITRLKERRYPTRAEIDKVAPHNPVVFRTGPDASLNSLALRLSGIDEEFRAEGGSPCRVERNARTGEPTGILRNCWQYIAYESSQSEAGEQDRLARLKELLADYNSIGITSIVDGNTGDAEVELYRRLHERGELTCRTFLALSVDAQDSLDEIEQRLAEAAESPLHEYSDMLWLRGVKTFLDGGMLTGSAYMREPWGTSEVYSIDDPAYRGMLYIEPEKLYRIARQALARGLQFTAHSVGDGAVHRLLDAYASIDREDFSVSDRRPSISHANFLSAEAIKQMQRLGVVANLQPAWLYLDAATLLDQFGEERLAYFQPYKSLFEHNVVVGGGSDHMQKIGANRSINPYNPFLGMWIALTRQARRMEGPLHPEQQITREQAIRLYTINNAYLTFEEDEKGSLEPGKLADFIVLDTDILECPIDEVKAIGVEQTYLGGRLIHSDP